MSRLARFIGFGRGQADDQEIPAAEPQVREAVVDRMDPEDLRDPVIEALRGVHDPELPVNIYDLGLIYRIGIGDNGDLDIDMTLTAPACPVAGMMPRMVEDAVRQVAGVGEVRVELVWDPPWTQDRMTDEARLQLGLM